MADPAPTTKYVFFACGAKSESEDLHKDIGTFSTMAGARVRDLCEGYVSMRGKPEAIVNPGDTVRFVHFNFDDSADKDVNNRNDVVQIFEWKLDSNKANQKMPSKTGGGNWFFPWEKLSDFLKDQTVADPPTFIEIADPGEMSIVNLYHSVRSAPDNSVLEVSLFAHGFLEGPVLMNTTDYNVGTRAETWPGGLPARYEFDDSGDRWYNFDKDGRKRTDFASNMGENPQLARPRLLPGTTFGGFGALAEFVGGFHPKGSFRVCGCNVQDKVTSNVSIAVLAKGGTSTLWPNTPAYIYSASRRVINQLLVSIGSKLGDKTYFPAETDVFTINMKEELAKERERFANDIHFTVAQDIGDQRKLLNNVDPNFLADRNTDDSANGTITRTWKEIVQFLAKRAMDSYVYQAAQALTPKGVTCYGTMAGYGSAIERLGKKEEEDDHKRNLWGFLHGQMRVCKATGDHGCHGEANGSAVKFFGRFFGQDTDDRAYAKFDAALVKTLQDRSKGIVPVKA